jgi:SAM-dependent methyltransferase
MRPLTTLATEPSSSADLLRCLDCAASLHGRWECGYCGRPYPEHGGIVEAIGRPTGRNRVAADFYGGEGWRRFQCWERRFLALMGGSKRARMPILRHLPNVSSARVLEVGIGDGENLPLLPDGWEVHGVDLARPRLEACLERFPAMTGRLVLAEAEALPFGDGAFDACLCVGGFTFFEGHTQALREMRRVTRRGGAVVVADEVPWLCRLGLGHLIELPRLDAVWLRWLGLPREFVAMVLDLRVDLDEVVRSSLPGSERHRIWGGLGYCIVHRGGPS